MPGGTILRVFLTTDLEEDISQNGLWQKVWWTTATDREALSHAAESPLSPCCLLGCLLWKREAGRGTQALQPTAHCFPHCCPHLFSNISGIPFTSCVTADAASSESLCPLGPCHSVTKVGTRAQGIANRKLDFMAYTRKRTHRNHWDQMPRLEETERIKLSFKISTYFPNNGSLHSFF